MMKIVYIYITLKILYSLYVYTDFNSSQTHIIYPISYVKKAVRFQLNQINLYFKHGFHFPNDRW